MKKYILIVAIFILNTLIIQATPVELYNDSWQILKDNFYDKTMNHQNWDYWKTKYQNISTLEDAYIAVETMIESLDDPYTVFMKAQEYKEERRAMEGKEKTIGIYLKKKNNNLYIYPVKGGRAEIAGIKNKDILLEINNKSVKDMTNTELDDALSIENSESIEFLIRRKHCSDSVYKIELKEKQTQSIFSTTPYKKTKIPKNIMYLRIPSFMDKHIAKQFQKLLDNNQDKDGYIIDLRYNSGGIAKNAAVMANMLLRNDIIVIVVDRDGRSKTIKANDITMTDKPIVVLCNSDSASASEIFAGAMKDNKRALIIGEKTFGKGIMQDIFTLPYNCGMNITVKHYLTPSGEFIHKKGIEPDIIVKMSALDYRLKNDAVLKKAVKVIESNINKSSETGEL